MLHVLFTCLWVPNLSLVVFIYLRQRLRLSRERLCTKAKTLPAQGLPKAQCPPRFFLKFFKNSDNFVETGRTSESFFWRKLKLARSKDDGLRGMMGCYSFKVPSANAPAATARRLASTPLVPSFIWSLFKSTRVTARDSSPKRCFHRQDLVTPQVFI
jgi:hypothetical protein